MGAMIDDALAQIELEFDVELEHWTGQLGCVHCTRSVVRVAQDVPRASPLTPASDGLMELQTS